MNTTALRALVEKWRGCSSNNQNLYMEGLSYAYGRCADELESALSQQPEGGAVAWATPNGYAVITEQFRNSIPGAKNMYTVPLYATPPPGKRGCCD